MTIKMKIFAGAIRACQALSLILNHQSSHQPLKVDIIVPIWRWTDWGSEKVGHLPKWIQVLSNKYCTHIHDSGFQTSCFTHYIFLLHIIQENPPDKHFQPLETGDCTENHNDFNFTVTSVGISEDQWWDYPPTTRKGIHLIKGLQLWFLTLL